MEGGEDDKGGGSLLEKRAGGEKLEEEGEEVNDQECTDLDTTDGGLPVVREIGEPENDKDAENASENIGDVADGVVRTNT